MDRLQSSVADAEERGVLIGTEATHLQVARIAMARGDADGARRVGGALERLHGMLGTSRTELYLLLVRSFVDRDGATVESCLRLARERGIPLELATVIGMLGELDLVGPDDLWECYDLFGELGALLCRSWVRGLMTRAGVTVPGRASVVRRTSGCWACWWGRASATGRSPRSSRSARRVWRAGWAGCSRRATGYRRAPSS